MPVAFFVGNQILNCYLRGANITPPSRVWVSLHTEEPNQSGGNEVSTMAWPAYVRRDPANGGAVGNGFLSATNSETSNTATLLWPEHNGSASITIKSIGIWNAATGGDCLLTASLLGWRTISPGDELSIRAGDLDIRVA